MVRQLVEHDLPNDFPNELDDLVVDEVDLLASICRDSFYEFVKEFWSEVSQEALVDNWHIKYLCDLAQRSAERVFANEPRESDVIVNVSPGTTKSIIFSIMFPAWCWSRMPSSRFICASHTHDLVLDLSRKCRDIVLSEKYQYCFGIELRSDQNTKGYFANTKGGMRFGATVGGKNPMGMHAHFLIVDDPLDPQQVASAAEIKTANNFMTETLPSRKINAEVTVTFLIMQRLHQNDPTGHMLAKADSGALKINHVCLPAEAAENISPPELRRYYRAGLFDPIRLTEQVLKEKLAVMGEFGFSGQYRQHPVPLGGGMFKVARLRISALPATIKWRKLVRYWDKAATDGSGAYTVGTLMGWDLEGRFWVLDVVRGQWESNERENVILNTAKMDGRNVLIGIEQEPGGGGKESAEASVKRLAGFRVRIDKVSKADGDKVLRADPFSVQVNASNVHIVQNTRWNRAFIEELSYFPFSTYKDQVDSASGGFNMMTKRRTKVGAF